MAEASESLVPSLISLSLSNGQESKKECLNRRNLRRRNRKERRECFTSFACAKDFLERNLVFKRVSDRVQNPYGKLPFSTGQKISKNIVALLRWKLPESGLVYSKIDGSVSIQAIAEHLGHSCSEVILASDPSYDFQKKERVVVLERISILGTELHGAAIGGHGFSVLNPPGHMLVGKEMAKALIPISHGTDQIRNIERSGFLSAMARPGGVNFSSEEEREKYKKGSSHRILIDLSKAMKGGIDFFENRFSGIVFGSGKWVGNGWDGKIPLEFCEIKMF